MWYRARAVDMGVRSGYRLMLTKTMMMHRDYLRIYTCGGRSYPLQQHLTSDFDPLRKTIFNVVDHYCNCEDIGMNFVASAGFVKGADREQFQTIAPAGQM